MSDTASEYITRREFDATTRYYDRALADMSRMRSEDSQEVKSELRRLADTIKKSAEAPSTDHIALAMQRLADAFEKHKSPGGGTVRLVAIAAIIGAVAYIYHLGVGHW